MLCRMTLSIFKCVEMENNNWFLYDDMSIQCFTTSHIAWAVGIGLIGVAYLLGIPMVMYFFLKTNKIPLYASVEFNSIDFLFRSYTPKYYYWELMILLRKAMIEVVILIFQSYGAVQQAVSLIILLSVFLLADIQASPYFSSKEQRFERFSLAIQIITFYLFCLPEKWAGFIAVSAVTSNLIFVFIIMITIRKKFCCSKKKQANDTKNERKHGSIEMRKKDEGMRWIENPATSDRHKANDIKQEETARIRV